MENENKISTFLFYAIFKIFRDVLFLLKLGRKFSAITCTCRCVLLLMYKFCKFFFSFLYEQLVLPMFHFIICLILHRSLYCFYATSSIPFSFYILYIPSYFYIFTWLFAFLFSMCVCVCYRFSMLPKLLPHFKVFFFLFLVFNCISIIFCSKT